MKRYTEFVGLIHDFVEEKKDEFGEYKIGENVGLHSFLKKEIFPTFRGTGMTFEFEKKIEIADVTFQVDLFAFFKLTAGPTASSISATATPNAEVSPSLGNENVEHIEFKVYSTYKPSEWLRVVTFDMLKLRKCVGGTKSVVIFVRGNVFETDVVDFKELLNQFMVDVVRFDYICNWSKDIKVNCIQIKLIA